jgi:hypothetical protein
MSLVSLYLLMDLGKLIQLRMKNLIDIEVMPFSRLEIL